MAATVTATGLKKNIHICHLPLGDLIGTAFGLSEGNTSKLVIGTNGVYAVQLTKFTPADELPNYQAAANRVGLAKSNAVNTKLYAALKDAADIEDNRATFY